MWSEAVLGGQAGEEADRVRGADVTSSFFAVLGVRPILGRAFEPEDEFKRIFAAAPSVLVVVALAACYLPARRASRVDPFDALKCE